jgi:hypothetical protein
MFVGKLIAAAVLIVGGAAHAATPPPLSAYGRLPAVEDLELSPSGDRIAFITVDGEQRQLVVQSLDGKERYRLNAGQAKVRDLAWAGEGHLLITTSTTGRVERFLGRNEWFSTGAFNLKTKKYVRLLDNTPGVLNAVMGNPVVVQHRGEAKVFVPGITVKGAGSHDLFRVDLDTGRGRVQEEGGREAKNWVVAPDGDVIARQEEDDVRGTVRTTVRDGAAWRTLVPSQPETEAFALVGLGRTDGTLMIFKRDGDRFRIHEVTMADGVVGPSARRPEADAGRRAARRSHAASHRPDLPGGEARIRLPGPRHGQGLGQRPPGLRAEGGQPAVVDAGLPQVGAEGRR